MATLTKRDSRYCSDCNIEFVKGHHEQHSAHMAGEHNATVLEVVSINSARVVAVHVCRSGEIEKATREIMSGKNRKHFFVREFGKEARF